ncbi:usg protein [Azospirillum sp. sgz301742]
MTDLARQLRDYRLTTAEILYHMPDHPALLQSFIWQDLDLAPEYPVLKRFLDYWQRNLDGPLHSVTLASMGIVTPGEVRLVAAEFRLH